MTARVLVLRAPGTNCDVETAFAFERAGGRPERVHLNRWLEQPRLVDDYQILCVPGGFSYGDDVAAGRIIASQVRHHLRDVVAEFVGRDRLVLGICNGFQALIKSGVLLADDDQGDPPATLTWNDSGRYQARWVALSARPGPNVFLRGVERLYLPIAHAEGKFIARDVGALARLETHGQLCLRYDGERDASGTLPFPANPNGSQRDVAGVCDPTGRVFGLMPHPERFIDRTQHPRWTRESLPDEGDGLVIFRNSVAYFA